MTSSFPTNYSKLLTEHYYMRCLGDLASSGAFYWRHVQWGDSERTLVDNNIAPLVSIRYWDGL